MIFLAASILLLHFFFSKRLNYPRKKVLVLFVMLSLPFWWDALFPLQINLPKSSLTVKDSQGRLLHAFLAEDQQWRLPVKYEKVSPEYVRLILFKEDKYFFYHFGINPFSVLRAVWQNLTSDRRIGASTITMQVARLLEPKPRTFLNKLLEMFRALQLEAKFSKKEILEMYLNLLPYGGNIVGTESAARIYFGKNAENLTYLEASAFCQLSDNPSLIYAPKELERRAKKFLKNVGEKLDNKEMIASASEQLRIGFFPVPKEIPHLAYRLKKKLQGEIVVYLHSDFQKSLEKIVKDYSEKLKPHNIANISVLVVRNKDGAVLSYIGSADFTDKENAGEVDGIVAYRSPGSTLKPFLYAYAMQAGMLTPKYVLYDVPTSYQGYSPRNYDSEFRGKVTAAYALSQSLNVPPVRLLHKIGFLKWTDFLLKNFDFKEIRRRKADLGQSIVLGGCEVSLEELTEAYLCLANAGTRKKLKYTFSDTLNNNEDTVFHPAVTQWITGILRLHQRPDFPGYFIRNTRSVEIAWKTGTSYGFKDAWSLGYSPEYTVGVWCGNFDGKPSPVLNGASVATPLLFRIFEVLPHSKKTFESRSNVVRTRKICAESGKTPSELCEHIIYDEYIPGITHIGRCDLHKKFKVSFDEKIRYCGYCLPKVYKEKVYNLYPASYLRYLRERGEFPEVIPPHNPACEAGNFSRKQSLEIVFPAEGAEYYVEKIKKMKLQLETGSEAREICVFLNGEIKGCYSGNKEIYILPREGKNELECIDDLGNGKKIRFSIKKL